MKLTNLPIPLCLVLTTCIFSQPGYTQTTNRKISKLNQEINQLRKQGNIGLETFLKTHSNELSSPSSPAKTALDQLCQQRDCYASKLYWYTDLEQAKIAAKKSNKPILSLRLLGKLDSDLSCANSRFFRVALYPNGEIAKYLKDNFILHWQSVRPVPVVTIDFGDGRKLKRTITGNSIHYILDSSGRPIDAIPGLYGPQAFLKQLQQIQPTTQQLNKFKGEQYENFLQQYHLRRLDNIANKWREDLSKLGIKSPANLTTIPSNLSPSASARLAGSLAVSKSVVERPIINAIEPKIIENTSDPLAILDQETWNKLAQLYQNDAKLDNQSIDLIKAKKLPNVRNERDLIRIIGNFEKLMALDTVRNEYMFHRQIHQWFLEGNETKDVNKLNEKVYAELFLTPNSDPWLGLTNNDAFNGLDNSGIVNSSVSN